MGLAASRSCLPGHLCIRKKSQICGIAVGPRVDEVPNNCFKVSSRINSTWGGTVVDMVRSTKLPSKFIKEENILDYVSNTAGPALYNGLLELQKEFPKHIWNVRDAGTMYCF